MSNFENNSSATGGGGGAGGGQLAEAANANDTTTATNSNNSAGTGTGPIPAEGRGGASSYAPAAADVDSGGGGAGGGGGSEPLTAEEAQAVLSEQPTGVEPSESEMGDRKDARSSADNLLPTDKLENGLKHVRERGCFVFRRQEGATSYILSCTAVNEHAYHTAGTGHAPCSAVSG